MNTIEGACNRLREKVKNRNIASDNGAENEDIKEMIKSEVEYFYRLIVYLCICMNSISPKAVNKLEEYKIGIFLDEMLSEIDPKIMFKNIHFGLAKLFQIFYDSTIPGVRQLCVECDYMIKVYKRYRKRYNLINSQFLSIFKIMAKEWTSVSRDFVKRNKEDILMLKNLDDEGISLITMKVLDWNDNIIESPPPKEDDVGTNSINSKPSNFNFQLEESSLYNVMYNSPEREKNDEEITLPSLDFDFENGNGKVKEFNMSENPLDKNSPKKIHKQFTLGNNEVDYEGEEENEAKLKLKNLLANMKRKEVENEENDITSFLNNTIEDDYTTQLEEPKRLTFKFLNSAIEDEVDDDGLLPPISMLKSNEDFIENEIDLDINLGKRFKSFEGNEDFTDEVEKKLKIN